MSQWECCSFASVELAEEWCVSQQTVPSGPSAKLLQWIICLMMFVLCDDTSAVLGIHLVLNHHSTARTRPLTLHSAFLLFRAVCRNTFHAIIFLLKIDSFFGKIIDDDEAPPPSPHSQVSLFFFNCQKLGSMRINGLSFHLECIEYQIIWPFKYALPIQESCVRVQQVFERWDWQVGTVCVVFSFKWLFERVSLDLCLKYRAIN